MSGDASEELWAWVARHPQDGWTQIAAMIQLAGEVVGPVPLVHRDPAIMEHWREIALKHQRSSGQEIALVRYAGTVVQRIDPRPQG